MNELDEMWAALAEHKPEPSYAEAWERMLRERTQEAAWAAAYAADAAWAAMEAAGAAEGAAWAAGAAAARAAQRVIDAIRRVQS